MGNPFASFARWRKVRHEVKFLRRLSSQSKALSHLDRTAALFWEGSVVGYVQGIRVENWFNYGKWVPAETDKAERFLNAIRETGEAVVLLGDDKGVVHALPEDGHIEVKIWPGLVE